MSVTQTIHYKSYDVDGNLIEESSEEVDATEYDLHDKARQALTTNATFLNLSAPTNAQTLQQVRALTSQMSGLSRLILREFSE
jgi:hypothetical protein